MVGNLDQEVGENRVQIVQIVQSRVKKERPDRPDRPEADPDEPLPSIQGRQLRT